MKTLYPLPSPIDDGSRICVRLWIPNISGHRQALLGAVYNLTRWYSWDRDQGHQAKEAATVWEGIYNDLSTGFFDGCGDEGRCFEYPNDHPIIEYAPNDPFRTPELTPAGYFTPPWYTNPVVGWPGVLPGDALVNFTSIPNVFAIPTVGFPRARIHVDGPGTINLELVQIPQGGLALITVDDNPLSAEFLDLTSIGITEITSLGFVLAALGIETDAALVNTRIWRKDIDGSGNHHIDVTFLPNVGITDEILVGFGGGIRSVVYCAQAEEIPVPVIPTFRFTEGCELQVSYDGASYVTVPGWSEFAAECFTGAPGAPGADGLPGAPGASVELQMDGLDLQWRQDDDSPTWSTLWTFDEPSGGSGSISSVNCRYARAFIDGLFNGMLNNWAQEVKTLKAGGMNREDTVTLMVTSHAPDWEHDAGVAFVGYVDGLWVQEELEPGYIDTLSNDMMHADNINSLTTRMACVMNNDLEFCPEDRTAFLYRYENWFNTSFWYERVDPLLRALMLTQFDILNLQAWDLFPITCEYTCADDEHACDDFPPPPPPIPFDHTFSLNVTSDHWDWDNDPESHVQTEWQETEGFIPTFGRSCISVGLDPEGTYLNRIILRWSQGYNEPMKIRLTLYNSPTDDGTQTIHVLSTFTDELNIPFTEQPVWRLEVEINRYLEEGDQCQHVEQIGALNEVKIFGIEPNPYD